MSAEVITGSPLPSLCRDSLTHITPPGRRGSLHKIHPARRRNSPHIRIGLISFHVTAAFRDCYKQSGVQYGGIDPRSAVYESNQDRMCGFLKSITLFNRPW